MASVLRSLEQVRDLFGGPGLLSTSAGVVSAGGGGVPGWGGGAAGGERLGAVALDSRTQVLAGADRGLDGFARAVAVDAATGRHRGQALITSAVRSTQALAPYSGSTPGRVALVSSLTDHLGSAGGLVTGYGNTLPARQAQLAALAGEYGHTLPHGHHHRHHRHGRTPPTMAGGGFRMPGRVGAMPGGVGMPDLGGLVAGRPHQGRRGGAGQSALRGPLAGTPLGSLTVHSSPREVAAAIIHEALRRGYSPQQAVVILADAIQESGLRPGAQGGGGLWHGIFQQDKGYPGRDDPNLNIREFFNRLDKHGGPGSPDIAKSIFWLQQRPGEPSAQAAFAHGRQAYLSEFMHQHGRASALFNEIVGV